MLNNILSLKLSEILILLEEPFINGYTDIINNAGFSSRKKTKKYITKLNLRNVKKKWKLFILDKMINPSYRESVYHVFQDPFMNTSFIQPQKVQNTQKQGHAILRNPQSNGICERFQRTVLNEFYRIAFRTKIYHSIEELQDDLDAWVEEYNNKRPHSGKYCFGKTPMQTFFDSLPLAKEKNLGQEHIEGDKEKEENKECQVES